MKTVIQQAIENLEELRQIANDKNLYYEGACYLRSISILTSLLPTEQEIIEQAYKYGQMSIDKMDSGATFSTKSASEYYTETFKTDK